MERILHQLRLVVYAIIYKLLHIAGGFFPRISETSTGPGVYSNHWIPLGMFSGVQAISPIMAGQRTPL